VISGGCDVCVHAGDAVLLVCRGEDYLGQPLAGRAGTALPCRPDEHLGDGERVLLLSTLLLLLRPWSLANWSRPVSQAHRLCSVMLLLMQACFSGFYSVMILLCPLLCQCISLTEMLF
jgi:hypothetical protein